VHMVERKPSRAFADMPPKAVNIDQAAVLLGGVSRAHVYRLITRGELRTVKSGARRIVPVTAIEEYLALRSA
jgi:excisionase family DNA binding protein